MRIACLGGGPAGLYFAISMKVRDPSHEIVVIERNRANDTFGWGVVLSDEVLDNLAQNVPGALFQYVLRADGSSFFLYSSEGIRDIYEVSPQEVAQDASAAQGFAFDARGDICEQMGRTGQNVKTLVDQRTVACNAGACPAQP